MAMFLLAAAIGALASACLIISIRQFQEKGFLFNNAWLWASEKERRTMDKKPHYHQSGVVFAFFWQQSFSASCLNAFSSSAGCGS